MLKVISLLMMNVNLGSSMIDTTNSTKRFDTARLDNTALGVLSSSMVFKVKCLK